MRRALAAGDEVGAALAAFLDVHLDPLELALHRQRAELGLGVLGVADLDALHHAGDRLGELVVPVLRDDRAAEHRADLPAHHGDRVAEDAGGGLDREIVAHDRRRLAAELERAAGDAAAADLGDALAGRRSSR